MSTNTIARFVGALSAIAIVIGAYFFDRASLPPLNLAWIIGIAVGSAIIALIISPYLSVVPYRWMRETADPRATVDDDRWDRFPYYGQPANK